VSTSALDILKQYWGYDSFRKPQDQIIDAVVQGHDTLALLPTGGGKSICFQIPGLILPGMTLVISPLIALMKDQVERLNRLGIPAAFINSSMGYHLVDQKLQKALNGTYKFLYISPERIESEMFQLRLPQMDVSLLAVDEAHCISQWGYDFRPSYQQIHQIREIKPDLPIIALTASAPPKVQEDIAEKLQLHTPKIFRKSFRRDNLRYFILEEQNVSTRILSICQRTQGTGIVYTRTRRLAERLAQLLEKEGISAAAYHGGMKSSVRDEIQMAWIDNQKRVIVATNAFGMGIDKPDVRFVIHYNLPFDIESYYQEAGRGGRDGQTALAIAFANPIDIADLQRWSEQKYPTWEVLKAHYQGLCTYFRVTGTLNEWPTFGLDIGQVAKALEVSPLRLYSSLKVLHQEGIVAWDEDSDDFSYLQILAHPAHIHQFRQQKPKLADFVDFMLRQVGGEAYNQDVRFLVDNWALKRKEEPQAIRNQLELLVKYELIQYIPSTTQPTLTFIHGKQKLVKHELNWAKYDFLKKEHAQRLKELLAYVENKSICRSLLIQQYFGEKAHEPCGKCDVCIGRHKTRLDQGEFKQVMGQLMQFIRSGKANYRKTMLEVPTGTPAQREKVLRYLLDKGIIESDAMGNLKVKE